MQKASHQHQEPRQDEQRLCVVRLDRIRFVVPFLGFSWKRRVPSVPGFKVMKDFEVRPRGKAETYRRVRTLENPKTGTKLFVQYKRAHGYLKPFRVTVVACDTTGILWPDLKAIGDAFADFKIRMAEVAFDFAPNSGVNQDFVQKHAIFGKSRPAHNPKYPDTLHYGTRRSAKFVRCYWKKEIRAYRVELELHSELKVPESDCLLYQLTVKPDDFRFVNFDWRTLDRHLRGKGVRGKTIAAGSRLHSDSIHKLLRYLRSAHINNLDQFLGTSEKDPLIRDAIKAWKESLSPRARNRRANEEEGEWKEGEGNEGEEEDEGSEEDRVD
jgi:hypothetical protein